jgi:hypothetical protein
MSDVPTVGMTRRRRLPNRRQAITETIQFAAANGRLARYEASVGFDELGRPKEIFLFGAKDGSDMAAALADTAVALSVALQHGVSAQSMAVSTARVSPADGSRAGMPASIIGAVLDLLSRFEQDLAPDDWMRR